MKIAAVQLNTNVGDFERNKSKIFENIMRAHDQQCDMTNKIGWQ
jgi:predicted amidohydrolase